MRGASEQTLLHPPLMRVRLRIVYLMRSSVKRRPALDPNSAMDSDTVRSPLRAPHGARHRGR